MAAEVFELITSVNLGGAENVAFELARHCTVQGERGRLVVVELFRSKGDYAQRKRQELEQAGIRVLTLSPLGKRPSMLFAPLALAWMLVRRRPAVVHAHTDLPDWVLAGALRLLRLFRRPLPKVMRTIHNVALWPTHPRLGTLVETALRDDAIAAVSEAALQAYGELRRSRGLPLADLRSVVYNGCALPVPRPLPFDLDANRCHIAFCGRFDQQKGIDALCPMVQAIQRQFPGRFVFHFIGAGPLQHLLDTLAQQAPDVRVHGPIPGVAAVLHAFDYLVMPSRFEGLPLVAIEAALAGVPVMAARAPGLTETLPQDWPLYFDLASPPTLLRLFQGVAQGELDRRALAKKARAFALERFGLATMINHYERLFARLVQTP